MMLPSIFGENLFDELFNFPTVDDFWGKRSFQNVNNTTAMMKTDVKEKENGYEVAIDLPGFKKEEVTAKLEDGYLTISAQKDVNNDEKDEDGKYIRRERYTGQCRRSFYVGEAVEDNEIKAKFEDGILKLEIPKKDVKAVEQKKYIAIEGQANQDRQTCDRIVV